MCDTAILMPENYPAIIRDFTTDLKTTFPEFSQIFIQWSEADVSIHTYHLLHDYHLRTFPSHFFDILYQTEALFSQTENLEPLYFLPGIDFKLLMNADGVSDSTRASIWKYLQLILATIMPGIGNKDSFGETAHLFDGIDEGELQTKLSEMVQGLEGFFSKMDESSSGSHPDVNDVSEEDLEEMKKMFESMPKDESGQADFGQFEKMFSEFSEKMGAGASDTSANGGGKKMPDLKKLFKIFENMPEGTGLPDLKGMFKSMPDPEKLHEHLKGLFDGKIGSLAKELTEEFSEELSKLVQLSEGEELTTSQIFQRVMRDPKKLIELMKRISVKLEAKMKSGEISKEDLMKEAGGFMEKFNEMGGEEFKSTMSKMMRSMGMKGNINMGEVKKMSFQQKHKERMLAKLEAKRQALSASSSASASSASASSASASSASASSASAYASNTHFSLEQTAESNHLVFKGDEKQEKSVAPKKIANDDWLDDYQTPVAKSVKKSKGKK